MAKCFYRPMANLYERVEIGRQAAEVALRQRIRAELGDGPAAAFALTTYRDDLPDLVTRQWQAAAKQAGTEARYGFSNIRDDLAYHGTGRAQSWADSGLAPFLWAAVVGDQLCGLVHGMAAPCRINVAHVVGAPPRHLLQGRVLSYAHTAMEALGRATGASSINYAGRFSLGSVKQVERGALPVTQRAYERMWRYKDVEVFIDPPPHITQRPRQPGDEPPERVYEYYHDVYRKLFGRPYRPWVI